MLPIRIEVGQSWRTRCGDVVRISFDRSECFNGEHWRWALSNGHIVTDDGCCAIDNSENANDLIKYLGNICS